MMTKKSSRNNRTRTNVQKKIEEDNNKYWKSRLYEHTGTSNINKLFVSFFVNFFLFFLIFLLSFTLCTVVLLMFNFVLLFSYFFFIWYCNSNRWRFDCAFYINSQWIHNVWINKFILVFFFFYIENETKCKSNQMWNEKIKRRSIDQNSVTAITAFFCFHIELFIK